MNAKMTHARRGSVLLLVIGLLTILAMLGGTFLLVARMDARQSKGLAQTSQADHLASGVVKTSVKLLMDDLEIATVPGGSTLPYANLGNGFDNWKKYIDAPGIDESGYITHFDVFNYITNDANRDNGARFWVSALLHDIPHNDDNTGSGVKTGIIDDATLVNDSDSPYYNSGDPLVYVDVDGDGDATAANYNPKDAILADMGLTTSSGEKIYMAVKVTDLSSKICINTSMSSDTATDASNTTMHLPLKKLVEQAAYMEFDETGDKIWKTVYFAPGGGLTDSKSNTRYERLNEGSYDFGNQNWIAGRYGDESVSSENDYYSDCGIRFFDPVNGTNSAYQPFAIGDEPYLRWQKNLVLNPNTLSARVATLLRRWDGDDEWYSDWDVWNDWFKRNLTTYSCSRELLRHPKQLTNVGFNDKIKISEIKNFIKQDMAAQDVQDRDEKLTTLADSFVEAGASPQVAAQLVANLWALCTPYETVDGYNKVESEDFKVISNGAKAYGLIQHPVITEGFATHVYGTYQENDPVDTLDDTCTLDYDWACAIEIFNPTEFDIDLSKYKIYVDTVDKGNLTGVLAAGDKVVYYNCKDVSNASDFFNTNKPGWTHLDGLEFIGAGASASRSIKLYRDPGVDQDEIFVDEITSTDIGYSYYVNEPVDTDNSGTITGDEMGGFSDSKNIACSGSESMSGQCDMYDSVRDDYIDTADLTRRFFAVAVYNNTNSTETDQSKVNYSKCHFLGDDNDFDASALGTVQKYNMAGIDHGNEPDCLADVFTDVYAFGFDPDNNQALTKKLVSDAAITYRPKGNAVIYDKDNILHGVGGGATAAQYPDIPWPLFTGEIFSKLTRDTTRDDDETRVYGRININTASKQILQLLPWPADLGGIALTDDDYAKIAEYIIAYRDGTSVAKPGTGWPANQAYRKYGDPTETGLSRFTRADATATTGISEVNSDILYLRDQSHCVGFLTPGEIAIPLWNYTLDKLISGGICTDLTAFKGLANYSELRNTLYRRVSNMLTVNSDVYAVNMRIQVGIELDEDGRHAKSGKEWYYVAVIDRSNCRDADDEPKVLLLRKSSKKFVVRGS